MKQEIKKIFLFLVLSCVAVFLFEAMLVLTMLLFYGFLEITLSAFALSSQTKEFLVGAFGFFCFIGIIAINFVIIIAAADNYDEIKNKILEWVNERV